MEEGYKWRKEKVPSMYVCVICGQHMYQYVCMCFLRGGIMDGGR